jgi:K+-sensing histidine kinase KdpD
MSETHRPGGTELKKLMRRVLESDACEAFEEFVVRQIALRDLAPSADDAVFEGVEASPDGGAAMAEAHLLSLPDQEREELLERARREAGRRLHAAAFALLVAVGAARLPVEVTAEMVAVAAITELGDSIPGDASPEAEGSP